MAPDDDGIILTRVRTLLEEACRLLDRVDEHAAAAFVGQGLALIDQRRTAGG